MTLAKNFPLINEYFRETTFTKKIEDASIIGILAVVIGLATGKLALSPILGGLVIMTLIISFIYTLFKGTKRKTTVEHSFKHSSKVKKILDRIQYSSDFPAVIHMIFHNGVSDLSRQFSFIKMTGMESSTADHITFNPLVFRDLPFMVDIDMIAALTKGNSYVKQISDQDPLYNQYKKIGIRSLCATPVYAKGCLNSFVIVGSAFDEYTFDIDTIEAFAKEIGPEL